MLSMHLKFEAHAQHALKIIIDMLSMRYIRFSPKIHQIQRQRLQNEFFPGPKMLPPDRL